MLKIAYNACFGGFSLSKLAVNRLKELGIEMPCPGYGYLGDSVTRHNSILIQVIEELGDKANGSCADLKIATISGNKYRIDEYDGRESIVEPYETECEWINVED